MISRFFNAIGNPSKFTITRSDVYKSWFSGAGTSDGYFNSEAGEYVAPETAMQLSAVFSCVKILSESMACFPLEVYRRLPDGGKTAAREHSLFKMLSRKPNRMQTSFEFRKMMQAHLSLRGNAYA